MPLLARTPLLALALAASGCAVLRPAAPPPSDTSEADRFSVQRLLEEEPGPEVASFPWQDQVAQELDSDGARPSEAEAIVLGLPDGAPQAMDAAAEAPNPNESTRGATPSRLVRGSSLFGRVAEDHVRVRAGSVLDFLVDPRTGEFAAVLTGSDDDAEPQWRRVLLYESLKWNGDGTASVIVSATEAGPARRDLVVELFEVQDPIVVEGQVMDVQEHGPGYLESAVVMVKDDDNLRHRLAIGPASLALPSFPSLSRGDRVRAEGVLTRDSRGRLVIVSRFEHPDATLRLRDENGAMLWDALTAGLVSAEAFPRATVTTADREEAPVVDWLCDWSRGAVTHVLVRVGETERAVAWERLNRTSAGWETGAETESLAALPEFVED